MEAMFLYWFGVLLAAALSWKLLFCVYRRFLRPRTSWKAFVGEWAIVTGASYGIGKGFAFELAKRGVNIVLVSRTLENLNAVGKEITSLYPAVQVHCEAADLSDIKAVESLERRLTALTSTRTISILVNNAGGLVGPKSEPFKDFTEFSTAEESSIFILNATAPSRLMRLVLPGMVSRRKGRIINVSSLSAFTSYKIAPYAAAKAYLNALTQAVYMEYSRFGIQIESALPGLVSTPATFNVTPRWDVCTGERFAQDELDLFGSGGNSLHIPYWSHALQAFFVFNLPPSVRDYFIVKSIESASSRIDDSSKTKHS